MPQSPFHFLENPPPPEAELTLSWLNVSPSAEGSSGAFGAPPVRAANRFVVPVAQTHEQRFCAFVVDVSGAAGRECLGHGVPRCLLKVILGL